MQQTLINNPRLTVEVRTGSEGPHHDPYGYAEYRAKTPETCVSVHIGLAVYAKIGSQRIDARGKDYDDPYEWGDRIMEGAVGYTIKQLERFHMRATSRCKEGGYHNTHSVDGYPGDHLEVCTKCGKVVDSYFCIEAVI